MQAVESLPSMQDLELALQVGDRLVACSKRYISEVIRIEGWIETPAAPEYVIGTVAINDSIYTLIDIRKTAAETSHKEPDEVIGESIVGLVIDHPSYHRIVIAGQRAVSLFQEQSAEWTQIQLPAPLITSKGNPPVLLFEKAN